MINLAKFKHVTKNARIAWETTPENIRKLTSYRDTLSFMLENEDFRVEKIEAVAAPVDKADELRNSLTVAARAAYLDGATASQINYIVSLAVKNNDFNILAGGRLTKHSASLIIENMRS